jgi:hypothetical protein
MEFSYRIILAAAMVIAGQLPSVFAQTPGECEALMASKHSDMFEKLRAEAEAEDDEHEFVEWAMRSSEQVKAIRDLALLCYRVSKESERDYFWSVSWSFRVIENGLIDYRELARPPGGLREQKAVVVDSIAYAAINLSISPQ